MARSDGQVRQYLSRVTRDVHEALHVDPVLRPLRAPGLTLSAYHAALGAFGTFYQMVEANRRRLGVYEGFALQDACDALREDAPHTIETSPCAPLFHTAPEVLGALYVAHGASFGRGTFRKNAMSHLPSHPHRFVQLRPDPSRWQALIAELDRVGACNTTLGQVETGAQAAFRFMRASTRQKGDPEVA